MEKSALDRIAETNAKLRTFLSHIREALAGRAAFTVQDVRAISEHVAQMEPIVLQTKSRGPADLHMNADLKTYAGILKELHVALEQARFMLLARQTHLAAARTHVATINLWVAALQQTQ